MTERERILCSIRGEVPDRMPWVPRLEFWYRARVRAGTMPAQLRGLSLREITESLGIGHYATVPDFTERAEESDMEDRSLGIFNVPVLPYRIVLDGVERRTTRSGNQTVREYHTPAGTVRTVEVVNPEMLDAGVSIPWLAEHAIKEPADFKTVGYIFSHLKVEPRPGYPARQSAVGDRGVAVGYANSIACPMQHIMKELMPLEQFFYALNDSPEELADLAEQMEPFYTRMKELTAETSAELILLGGNYADSITHPKFFEKYILPPLRDYAEVLHGKGKYLITHTDGENRLLMPLYLRAGFDVADSVCPAPMTRLTLDQLRTQFGPRVTIWGGIPSVLLCRDGASESEFRTWIDNVIGRYGHQSRFVLGVSDMVTADAEWSRIEYITEQIARL